MLKMGGGATVSMDLKCSRTSSLKATRLQSWLLQAREASLV